MSGSARGGRGFIALWIVVRESSIFLAHHCSTWLACAEGTCCGQPNERSRCAECEAAPGEPSKAARVVGR